jgi:histone H3/H4
MEEEQTLPRSTLSALIKKSYGPHITNQTAEVVPFVNVLAVEFIKLLSTKANEICAREGKKTINTEHMLSAVREIGMEELYEEICPWMEEYSKTCSRSVKLTPLTSELSVDELAMEQRILLERAQSEHGPVSEPIVQADHDEYD